MPHSPGVPPEFPRTATVHVCLVILAYSLSPQNPGVGGEGRSKRDRVRRRRVR
ncbi:hypothetical protein [Oxynema aestuarii]|uniref:hypothetical protein n=1 Tax=Oxynema aestuarii TaxID=2874213 RepID=UPI0040553DCC